MDTVTHLLIGAAVAQLVNKVPTETNLSWQKCALLGAFSAVFPDIDYLLFFVNPLEFLAYWHRAETHSLILAPLWAWILSFLLRRFYHCTQQTFLFKICLVGILSHIILDSFTTFGTQWFAPFSNYKVSWNLLFVVDVYFTFMSFVALMLIIYWRSHHYRLFALCLPMAYLTLVVIVKLAAYHQIPATESEKDASSLTLLPQPFSPLYWQVIKPTETGIKQTYLMLSNDVIATKLSEFFWQYESKDNYQLPQQLIWRSYSTVPKQNHWQADAQQVWQQQKFAAFRDFAVYPVFYQYQKSSTKVCVWFSDLRYHWPNIMPSFRIGMCRKNQQSWQLYRMKYLSHEQIQRIY